MSGTLNAINQVVDNVALVVADAVIIANMFAGPQWGVFLKDGTPYLTGNAVVGVDYRRGYRIPTYPVEGGTFASYNKVQEPYDAMVAIAVDGSESFGFSSLTPGLNLANRHEFLADAEAALGALTLYDVRTPEYSYHNASIVHVGYRRQSRGSASMLVVEVGIQEVRVAPNAAFSNTAAASGADSTNGGSVQPIQASTTGRAAGPV